MESKTYVFGNEGSTSNNGMLGLGMKVKNKP